MCALSARIRYTPWVCDDDVGISCPAAFTSAVQGLVTVSLFLALVKKAGESARSG
jgi:hypothetical protein